MIKIDEIEINNSKDYNLLLKLNLPELVDKDVIDFLKKRIRIKHLILSVEYPYYDKDYLSTFYLHYSQKFRQYPKACCRLHFQTENEYLGYIVLRPTMENTKIGRTYASPKLFMKSSGYVMLSVFKAHLLGYEEEIECFPWKRQQTDISVCAHTAVWTIIRYFGNKPKGYADATIGDIVANIDNDWGRKTPSLGLNPVQVSDIFKKYKFSPLIIEISKEKREEFNDEIISYIESGLPMVGFLSPQNHAISLIGHGGIDTEKLFDEEFISHNLDDETGIILQSRLVDKVYGMDDRYLPYCEIPVDLPSKTSDVGYGLNELYYAVVPLYSRMQLSYREVYNRMEMWLKRRIMTWDKINVCRIYITSSNALKREAVESDDMNITLKEVITALTFPKFVWCIDLADIDSYIQGKISGRIIIDTTAATHEPDPWILMHNRHAIRYKEYDIDSQIPCKIKKRIAPYTVKHGNLKKIDIGEDND